MGKRYPKLNFHFICDDIRHEEGNKSTFVGVFRSNIIVISKPYVIPKLCFLLSFNGVKSGDVLKVQMLDPDDKEILGLSPVSLGSPKKSKVRSAIIEATFAGLQIKKEGTYRLLCVFDEEDKAKQEIKFEIKKED
jgi:hypothetical protein